MKYILSILFSGLFVLHASAQCKSGNCFTGHGTYDFGWCVYTGDFKNGKPEGKGVMKYDDYSYSGDFKAGLEDGEGTITKKDGSTETVKYIAGRRSVIPVVKLSAGEYKPLEPQDVNCISGNCINGFGTYQFPSGNKYVGAFKDYKREGSGTFYFQNGDQFTGSWENNTEKEGTYSYATGPQYIGTYDSNGHELNGRIQLGGRVIPFVNGKAVIPPPPEIKTDANDAAPAKTNTSSAPVQKICPICHGSKTSHFTIPGGSYKFDRYGNKETIFGEYTNCILCGGRGYIN